jgi:hypothetical protein
MCKYIKTEVFSATSSDTSESFEESKDSLGTPTICETFSSAAGNVFFKSSDQVIFRVEDFYLKANR